MTPNWEISNRRSGPATCWTLHSKVKSYLKLKRISYRPASIPNQKQHCCDTVDHLASFHFQVHFFLNLCLVVQSYTHPKKSRINRRVATKSNFILNGKKCVLPCHPHSISPKCVCFVQNWQILKRKSEALDCSQQSLAEQFLSIHQSRGRKNVATQHRSCLNQLKNQQKFHFWVQNFPLKKNSLQMVATLMCHSHHTEKIKKSLLFCQ